MDKEGRIINFDARKKVRDAALAIIDEATQKICENPVSEGSMAAMAHIYTNLIRELAKAFSSTTEIGSRTYNISESSILLGISTHEKPYTDLLEFLRQHLYAIPGSLRKKMVLYVGEHDSFLDSTCVRIDEKGLQIIPPETIPLHEDELEKIPGPDLKRLEQVDALIRAKFKDIFHSLP